LWGGKKKTNGVIKAHQKKKKGQSTGRGVTAKVCNASKKLRVFKKRTRFVKLSAPSGRGLTGPNEKDNQRGMNTVGKLKT